MSGNYPLFQADTAQTILSPSPDALSQAITLLEAGHVIGFPTETVYGLAGHAFHLPALTRIFEIKNRPLFDPLIIHTAKPEAAFALAQNIPEKAQQLAHHFWPGPLTLILAKKPLVPDLATSGLTSVALRVPSHPVAQALLQALSFPLAAPSANRFGRISPTTAGAVYAELGDQVPLILEGGPCAVGLESTVVDFTGSVPLVRRAGGIALEDLEKIIGSLEIAPKSDALPQAPGELKHHYCPRKPLYLVSSLADIPNQPHAGWLTFGSLFYQDFAGIKLNLSPSGNLSEAATHFFTFLRALDDHPQITQIYTQLLPEFGLGRAINERLERAQTSSRPSSGD